MEDNTQPAPFSHEIIQPTVLKSCEPLLIGNVFPAVASGPLVAENIVVFDEPSAVERLCLLDDRFPLLTCDEHCYGLLK